MEVSKPRDIRSFWLRWCRDCVHNKKSPYKCKIAMTETETSVYTGAWRLTREGHICTRFRRKPLARIGRKVEQGDLFDENV